MLRLIYIFTVATVAVIIVAAVLLLAPTIVGGFSDTVGEEQNFNTTGNQAVGFGNAHTIYAIGGLLAIPLAVVLAVFFHRRRTPGRRGR